ncbi:hypothetical protein [Rhodococcus tibetensis]|uniref:Uncharacterized protein n=1 Tax=Rhodococcus tibetensis TaxID=2965064 RepID=A0ABT1QBB5_9NOCA|nr:hypothetical protein [Rhodococcus sp. FXJ9.536]MCQ4118390.1 hypothetical protein [Rhodococcus sp. FXJ9.536]
MSYSAKLLRSVGSVHGLGQSDAELPDLVLAYGTNGETGYVKSSALTTAPATVEEVTKLPTTTLADGTTVFSAGPSTVPLYAEDGVTVIGEFAFSWVSSGCSGSSWLLNRSQSIPHVPH